jgi:hypothetical protein
MSHQYLVKLYQIAESHSESFTVEADNKAEALKAGQLIVKTKDLDPKIKWGQLGAFRLEAEDLSVDASAGAVEPQLDTPTDGLEAADAPQNSVPTQKPDHTDDPDEAEERAFESQAEDAADSTTAVPEPEER